MTPVEVVLNRERLVVVCGLVIITGLAWWWILTGAGTGMSVAAMSTWEIPPPLHPPMIVDWSASYAVIMFFMWWIMMIAMMLPSAAPTILLYAHAPARFLATNFKPGPMGAFQMGITHDAYCLGCCSLLMVLLFAGGIMNLVWIAGLAILVLAEKALPHGPFIALLGGLAMISGWLWILARAYLM